MPPCVGGRKKVTSDDLSYQRAVFNIEKEISFIQKIVNLIKVNALKKAIDSL